jgi:hypothetical protein
LYVEFLEWVLVGLSTGFRTCREMDRPDEDVIGRSVTTSLSPTIVTAEGGSLRLNFEVLSARRSRLF